MRTLSSALAAALLLPACARPPAASRPNVLFVTVDTLRADHCSAYGYRRTTTPRLEALAGEGTRFETAYAPMPTTAPSHATMFTALLPRSHGVLKNGQPLGPGPRTLAEVLHAAGYRTAAFVSAAPVDRHAGLGRGFDEYDDVPSERTGEVTRRRAEAWLARHGYLRPRADRHDERPFFVWVHLYDPHSPYLPPPAYAARFPSAPSASELEKAVDAYDGEVRFADAQVGALVHHLDQAGRASQTLVVVTADHGEGLMDHGIMGHGLSLYEETLRVPLVFRWPGTLPAKRVTEPVQLVDLAPTISELAGIQWTGTSPQGRSLAAILLGKEGADPRREAFFQRRQYDTPVVDGFRIKGDKHAVRAGRWKYIVAPEEGTAELYDLVADPAERHDLRRDRVAEADGLDALIKVWHRATARAPSLPVDEERARALRALGYVQ
ncbi:MAG TPA: sulfatase [Vicinamibacteria bacterium]|nr:sulfatase [Vicinamibacteria bacterium]